MTSSRRLVHAFAMLALLASVAFADVAMARRQIGFAKEIIDRNEIGRIENARGHLRQAQAALSNVPEAERTPILQEIQALSAEADRKEREYHVRNADGMLQREYDQLKEAAEGKGRSSLSEISQVEPLFVRIENHLKMDIVVKNFSPEHMAEWRQKVDALRGVALRTVIERCVKEAEEWLQKVEERNASQSTERQHSEETYEQYLGYAMREIEKLPDSDDRKQQLKERHKAATSARMRRLALDAKERAVGAIREWWAHTQRQHEGSWNGWERENPYEFSQWWREHGRMNLERTEARWAMGQAATEDSRWEDAVKAHSDDQRVKAIVDEVNKIKLESATKICAAAEKFLTGAEDKAKESPAETKDRVLRVVEKLEKYASSCPAGPAALDHGRALLNRIHEIEVNGSDPGPSTPTATATGPTGTTPEATTPSGTGEPQDEPEASGPSFLSLFFGCACCFLFLGAIGGGAFFVMKQQKAAAAGAAPPPAA